MGAISVPDRFTDLTDTPSSIVASKYVRGNTAGTALQFLYLAIGAVNVKNYGAAGGITTTTLAADIGAGGNTATLADASSYAVGHDMAIPGAGVAGAELVVDITAVNGNVVTFSPATSTGVSTGITVHHDDTQAINDALATGSNVFVPVGGYNICGGSKTIDAITVTGQHLFGAGRSSVNNNCSTRFYSRSTTATIFRVFAGEAKLSNFNLSKSSTIGAITAGDGILVGDASGGPIYFVELHNITVSSMYHDLRLSLASQSFFHHLILDDPVQHGLYVNAPNPRGGNYYANILVSATLGTEYPASSPAPSGVFIDSADIARWVNVNSVHFPINWHLRSDVGGITSQTFVNCGSDCGLETAGEPFKLEKTNYTVRLNKFLGFQANTSTKTSGVDSTIGAGVEDTVISNFTYTGFGTIQVYGDNTQINSMVRERWMTPSSTADGIVVKTGADGTLIQGGRLTDMRYGVNLEAGSGTTRLLGVDLRGNSSGAYLDNSTGAIIANNVLV